MIPGMPSLGGTELLIILAIILLFFGAKRVPELAKGLGKGIRGFRQGTAEASNAVNNKELVRDGDEEKPSLHDADHEEAPLRTQGVRTTRSGVR